ISLQGLEPAGARSGPCRGLRVIVESCVWRIEGGVFLMSFCRTINLIAKEEYAVEEDNLVGYRNPGVPLPVADALTEVLRRGAGELLQQAVEVEVAAMVDHFAEL